MTLNFKLLLLLIASYLLLITFTPPVFAGHEWGSEGWYCDNNQVWHDIPGNKGKPYGHELWDPCGGDQVCVPQPPPNSIYTQDAACVPIVNLPQSGDGTKMHLLTSNIHLGDKLSIGIGADKVCYDTINIDPSLDQNQNSLKVFGRLPNCQTVDSGCGCETKQETYQSSCTNPSTGNISSCTKTKTVDCGPDDWNQVNPFKDDKRCWKKISCDTNSLGTLNAPLVTNNTNCNNNVGYNVLPVGQTKIKPNASCIAKPHAAAPQNEQNLEDSSQAGNKENLNRYLKGTVPAEATADTIAQCLNQTKKAGLLDNAFGVNGFICNLRGSAGFLQDAPIISFFLDKITANVCPKDVHMGGQDFDCYSKLSKVAAKTSAGVNDPQEQDCFMTDYKDPQGNPSAGNQEVNDLSSSLGGPNGYLSNDTPEFPLQLNNTCNLNTEGKILNDNRGPDINARCDKNCSAHYPTELCLPGNSILCQKCQAASSAQAPSETCKQACFSTLDECQKGCESKTGHDKDNCNNECVISKDKCLKAC